MAWDAAFEGEHTDLTRHDTTDVLRREPLSHVLNQTGSDAAAEEDEDEEEDKDLMREIYESMEAHCGLCGEGTSSSASLPALSMSRPSWRLADALSQRNEGAHAASSDRWWSDAPNGAHPTSQVSDERSGGGVRYLSQGGLLPGSSERWSSQASHASQARTDETQARSSETWSSLASHTILDGMSPASLRSSPHHVAHNRDERLGRARRACRRLELDLGLTEDLGHSTDLGLSTDLGEAANREEHEHTARTGGSGKRARRAVTGKDEGSDGEACASGGANMAHRHAAPAGILMKREDGDVIAREQLRCDPADVVM